MSKTGIIQTIIGPLVVATDIPDVRLYDIVTVGHEQLLGEVVELRGNRAWIQVYEETSGVRVGESVTSAHQPLSVRLGPGLLTQFYDGIQRPLESIYNQSGSFIGRGIQVPPLDEQKKWEFTAKLKTGDKVTEGQIIGVVPETSLIEHKILVPPGVSGKITKIKSGSYKISQAVGEIELESGKKQSLMMYHDWPIRQGRRFARKLSSVEPLLTGQRIVDTFFPIVKGGTAATPGPFGSGKTVIQQQFAKWCNAQIIVYVGCGERGNEMTDVLKEFPELKDPATGKPLMERTVLIANTSNMPIAAREASIYTGITIAEYYRDMGYDVAIMADSTSRWAEALREISSRLEEMPGEEGYPAYLAGRIAQFYERAGSVVCLGGDDKKETTGSVTVVGAVSPPGGDLSEPVSQGSLRVAKVYWALDGSLAYARHYPAIHWLQSYSLYSQEVDEYNREKLGPQFPQMRQEAMKILQQEAKLQEIIRIVGMDSLSNLERIVLDTARTLREDYLQQNAFDDTDTYASMDKQVLMLKAILSFHQIAVDFCRDNPDFPVQDILSTEVKKKLPGMKYVEESKMKEIEQLPVKFQQAIAKLAEAPAEPDSQSPPLHTSISHTQAEGEV